MRTTFEVWANGKRKGNATDVEKAVELAEGYVTDRKDDQVTVFECSDEHGVKAVAAWIGGRRTV